MKNVTRCDKLAIDAHSNWADIVLVLMTWTLSSVSVDCRPPSELLIKVTLFAEAKEAEEEEEEEEEENINLVKLLNGSLFLFCIYI